MKFKSGSERTRTSESRSAWFTVRCNCRYTTLPFAISEGLEPSSPDYSRALLYCGVHSRLRQLIVFPILRLLMSSYFGFLFLKSLRGIPHENSHTYLGGGVLPPWPQELALRCPDWAGPLLNESWTKDCWVSLTHCSQNRIWTCKLIPKLHDINHCFIGTF